MQELIVILVDGLVFSSYLFMVSVGLTVIFGVMKNPVALLITVARSIEEATAKLGFT